MSKTRITTDVLLFLALFIAPWWIVGLGALTAVAAFDFTEIILLAFLYDLLYAAPLWSLHVPFFLTLLSCMLYGVATLIKSYTRFNG